MNLYQKLNWLFKMGADESVGEAPVNRFQKKASVPARKPESAVSATPSYDTKDDIALHQAMALADSAQTLGDLYHALNSFDASSLKRTAMHTVFAKGTPEASVMFIGDVPDGDDDKQGIPYAGESGVLLDKMLAAIDLSLSDNAYVAMLVPWRPPGNRKPTPAEIAVSLPFIKKHIELISPDVLVLFGGLTAGALLGIDSISKARSAWQKYQSETDASPIDCLVTFSPAFLLKNAAYKRHAWEDLQKLQRKLNGESQTG